MNTQLRNLLELGDAITIVAAVYFTLTSAFRMIGRIVARLIRALQRRARRRKPGTTSPTGQSAGQTSFAPTVPVMRPTWDWPTR